MFKRLKHRSKLESVSGLSQHALLVDVAAKVLADNLASLVCAAACEQAADDYESTAIRRVCNRSYAAAMMQRSLVRLVLGLGNVAALLDRAIELLGANTQRRVKRRSCARPPRRDKPHPSMAYKG